VPGTVASARPLDGLRVVDLTRYLPGPYCTRLLADLGADVVKVEPPGGDPVRKVAAWYDSLNAGKRAVTIDLREERGRGELDTLLASAHVCVEGFRPSTARTIGVDAATLRARHPHLVHCSISGYGQTGEDAERAGHDINYQAQAGILGEPPRVPPLLIADMTGGLHAAIRILAALVGQGSLVGQGFSPATDKLGSAIDISLAAAASCWTPFIAPPILRGEYACYNVYETADRRHAALGALEPKFWERFCACLGKPEWIPLQFAGDPARTTLLRDVRALMATRPLAAWMSELSLADCCFSAASG
jgi:crotonobetainyl-CoA:carnitine CoA-transferase CaiB-like acyl-CoA transferase